MPQVPDWRVEPEEIWISCQAIREIVQSDEVLVQFRANGEEYVAFVPERFVDRSNNGLRAFIIADFGDSWLVDIPNETLTSGSRIRVPDAEKTSVLAAAGTGNGS